MSTYNNNRNLFVIILYIFISIKTNVIKKKFYKFNKILILFFINYKENSLLLRLNYK